MPRRKPADAADLFLDASADSHVAHASTPKLPASTAGFGVSPMTEISRAALFGKLNPIAYRAIEGATVFCKLRGNPYVELVHWMHQILQAQDSDLHRIVRHFELDPARLAADVTAALDRLPRGATAISDLSPQVEEAVERGWVFAHADVRRDRRSAPGICVLGALKTPTLRNALYRDQPAVRAGEGRGAGRRFRQHPGGSPEAALAAADGSQGRRAGRGSGGMAPAAMGKQEALKQFSIDLTERARDGEIDPIVGRDAEIRQVVDVLMRRRQNNPILTGEAGRRQDRGGGGFRAAHRPGRRAADAEGRQPADARCRPAAGRRQHEGRVRDSGCAR